MLTSPGEVVFSNVLVKDDRPYWLREKDQYLNGKLDKGIWMKWMELRVHGEADAIDTPTGMTPTFQELQRLFKDHRRQDYTQQEYVRQFTIRIPENLAKLDRIEKVYRRDVPDTPEIVLEVIAEQRSRLEAVRDAKGDYVSPLDL